MALSGCSPCGSLYSPFAGRPFFLSTRIAAIILAKPILFWYLLDLILQPSPKRSVRSLQSFQFHRLSLPLRQRPRVSNPNECDSLTSVPKILFPVACCAEQFAAADYVGQTSRRIFACLPSDESRSPNRLCNGSPVIGQFCIAFIDIWFEATPEFNQQRPDWQCLTRCGAGELNLSPHLLPQVRELFKGHCIEHYVPYGPEPAIAAVGF